MIAIVAHRPADTHSEPQRRQSPVGQHFMYHSGIHPLFTFFLLTFCLHSFAIVLGIQKDFFSYQRSAYNRYTLLHWTNYIQRRHEEQRWSISTGVHGGRKNAQATRTRIPRNGRHPREISTCLFKKAESDDSLGIQKGDVLCFVYERGL